MTVDTSAADQLAHIGTFKSVAEILAVFRPVMHAMAAAAGPGCEVVLHDLSDPEPDLGHTIVAIENGQVTGRKVGGPSTNLGARVIHNQADDHNVFAYQGLTSDGRRLRCSSVYFRNPEGRIIAALCVNYDVSALAQARALIDDLLTNAGTDVGNAPDEYIGRDLMAVMDAMIAEAIGELGKPVDRMSRADRIAVLSRLDQQGATQMRKGVETIANRLGISRVTAYAYLEEARKQTPSRAGE